MYSKIARTGLGHKVASKKKLIKASEVYIHVIKTSYRQNIKTGTRQIQSAKTV